VVAPFNRLPIEQASLANDIPRLGCSTEAIGQAERDGGAMTDLHPQESFGGPGLIEEVLGEQIQVAGDVFEVDSQTWAIHGYLPGEGEVLLAEFARPERAESALQQLSETR
jgi:hypothetical protein